MSPSPQPSITQLFTSFLRLGITAFGGPSMVAYIRKMAVEEKRWLDAETFSDGVALCQIIPGATAMQMSAYVGLKTRGVIGAGASFIGFGLPAFLLMMAFATLYTYAHTLPIVVSAFCYRTENPFVSCRVAHRFAGKRKLTGTRLPSRWA
jgi:chromate transporter